MKFFQKRVGSIFIVPLFLPSEYTDNIKSYASVDFSQTERYAFGRLIEVDKSGGDLVEIFNYIGAIPSSPMGIVNSGLMFKPLHISLGFKKKRWRFIFEDPNYDKIRDSNYQEITFLMGTPEMPALWVGGEYKRTTVYDCESYRKWIVFTPTEVEGLIKELI